MPLAPKPFFWQSIFRQHQVCFAQSFRVVLFVARVRSCTDIADDDASADWKQLKEQLCNCGDANVAAFLSNYRRSNAVMQLSRLNLALLRPLRASVTPNSLFSTTNTLNPSSVFESDLHISRFGRASEPALGKNQQTTRTRLRRLGFLCRRFRQPGVA